MLAGVTIVTHGFYIFGGSPMGWVDSMADGIADRADAALGSSTRLDLVLNSDFSVGHTTPQRSLPTTNSSAEIVIGFDWTEHSGDTTSTPRIAQSLANVLLSSSYWGFIGLPGVAELPIHLIGHSRGGSLIGELARLLGKSGLWVDQVTTLDPHPAREIGYSDPDAVLYTNTIFGDNYRQTNSYPTGASVAGAFQDDITGASPSPGHSDVHAFYHGTVKTGAGSDGAGGSISGSWYTTDPWPGARADTGFRYSLIGGGDRTEGVGGVSSPRDGLWNAVGGEGGRTGFSPGDLAGAVWSNATGLTLDTDRSLVTGQSVTTGLWYMDHDSDAYVQLYLDTDRNPYNSSPVFEAGEGRILSRSDLARAEITWAVPHTGGGAFYLYAAVADGSHTRYAYLPGAVTITDPLPDLAGTRILAPRALYSLGERINLGATVVNRGPASAPEFTATWYLATESGTLVRSLDDDTVPNLARGVSAPVSLGDSPGVGWLIPGDLAPGRYRIMVQADSFGAVSETDETDNWVSTGVFTIAGGSRGAARGTLDLGGGGAEVGGDADRVRRYNETAGTPPTTSSSADRGADFAVLFVYAGDLDPPPILPRLTSVRAP